MTQGIYQEDQLIDLITEEIINLFEKKGSIAAAKDKKDFGSQKNDTKSKHKYSKNKKASGANKNDKNTTTRKEAEEFAKQDGVNDAELAKQVLDSKSKNPDSLRSLFSKKLNHKKYGSGKVAYFSAKEIQRILNIKSEIVK